MVELNPWISIPPVFLKLELGNKNISKRIETVNKIKIQTSNLLVGVYDH